MGRKFEAKLKILVVVLIENKVGVYIKQFVARKEIQEYHKADPSTS